MTVPVNNNLSPLAFYEVTGTNTYNQILSEYLLSNRPYSYGYIYDLITYGGRILPFLFGVNYTVNSIVSGVLYNVVNNLQGVAIDVSASMQIYSSTYYPNRSWIYCLGTNAYANRMLYGRNFIVLVVEDSNGVSHTLLSEIFNNTGSNRPADVIHIEYTNTHDLLYSNGAIWLATLKMTFELNLKTTIGKPSYSYDEQVTERLGYRYVELQISKKSYQFVAIVSEYLCDAMRIIPMCNSRSITDNLYGYMPVESISFDIEWETQGNVAALTAIFDTDTVIANLAECNSIAPDKTFINIQPPPVPAISAPVVDLLSLDDVTANSVQATGAIVNTGNSPILSCGFCFSSSNTTPTLSDSVVQATNGSLFISTILNLLDDTTYYVRAFATNAAGTGYSSVLPITTLVIAAVPTVETGVASNITETTADCPGYVSSDGGNRLLTMGICLAQGSAPTIDDMAYYMPSPNLSPFICTVYDLTPGTSYNFRAFAINDIGIAYGQLQRLYTSQPAVLPEVVTIDGKMQTKSSAEIKCEVISEGSDTVTERGVCWGTTPAPDIASNKEIDASSGVGEYSAVIQGLTSPNTTYYFRAYAISNVGVAYGMDIPLTTPVA